MATQKRPLSPHLQVYRLPMLAIMSIVHRGTGVFNAAGALILAIWIAAVAAGVESYEAATTLIASPVGKVVLLGFAFSLLYHFFNGVRHLLWDIGWGYEIPRAYASGYMVLLLSLAATLGLATIIFAGGQA